MIVPREITQARRECIVRMMQRMGRPMGLQEVIGNLAILHKRGEWPQVDHPAARNEPYYVGVRQHLLALRMDGRVIQVVKDDGWKAWAIAQPELLLPAPAADYLLVADRYRAATGVKLSYGVRHNMQRVLLMETPRGVGERELRDDETWDDALREIGATE